MSMTQKEIDKIKAKPSAEVKRRFIAAMKEHREAGGYSSLNVSSVVINGAHGIRGTIRTANYAIEISIQKRV